VIRREGGSRDPLRKAILFNAHSIPTLQVWHCVGSGQRMGRCKITYDSIRAGRVGGNSGQVSRANPTISGAKDIPRDAFT
jgi:hypothetical protein